MSPFEKLDAYKACHELVIATHPVIEALEKKDPELAIQLWSAALVSSSRIARGSGFGNRKMFQAAVWRSMGALSEIGYHLNLADGLGLVPKEDCQRLESLRGRPVFYTTKLAFELAGGDGPQERPSP